MIQNKKKYLNWIKREINDVFADTNASVFLFGSSVTRETFGDIDIGVAGDVSAAKIRALRDRFEESSFPFFVDVVNFNAAKDAFKQNVFRQPLLWMKRST